MPVDLADIKHDLAGHSLSVIKSVKQGPAVKYDGLDLYKHFYRTTPHSPCCGVYAIQAVWTFTLKADVIEEHGNKPYYVLLQNPMNYKAFMNKGFKDWAMFMDFETISGMKDLDKVTVNRFNTFLQYGLNNLSKTSLASFVHLADAGLSASANTKLLLPSGVLLTPNGTYHATDRFIPVKHVHYIEMGLRISRYISGLSSSKSLYQSLGSDTAVEGIKNVIPASGSKASVGYEVEEQSFGHTHVGCDCSKRQYDVDSVIKKLKELM